MRAWRWICNYPENSFLKGEESLKMWGVCGAQGTEEKGALKQWVFMFAGINMFWARLRLILTRAVRRRLKWVLRIFTPKNINCITIIITVEGIEKIKTEKKNKNDNKAVWGSSDYLTFLKSTSTRLPPYPNFFSLSNVDAEYHLYFTR